MVFQVIVCGIKGQDVTVDLCETEVQMKNMTVRQLKAKIAQRLPGITGEDAVRLIFTDKTLEGDSTPLSEYKIEHMSVIHLVVKQKGGLTA